MNECDVCWVGNECWVVYGLGIKWKSAGGSSIPRWCRRPARHGPLFIVPPIGAGPLEEPRGGAGCVRGVVDSVLW